MNIYRYSTIYQSMIKNQIRSLIHQGGGKYGLNMSLPVEWIKEHGLNKGDQVKCTEEDGKLIIEVIKDDR